jgi:hypothetical protein
VRASIRQAIAHTLAALKGARTTWGAAAAAFTALLVCTLGAAGWSGWSANQSARLVTPDLCRQYLHAEQCP